MKLMHIALVCSSLDRAKRFYQDFLRLEQTADKSVPGQTAGPLFGIEAEMRVLNFKRDGLLFEIFIHDQPPKPAGTLEHTCLAVDDVEVLLERAEREGVQIRQVPKGNKLVTFIADFDGNLFEIIQA